MRGHIRKRGRNSWAIVLDLGRDEHGRRRQKWHAVRGVKRDAERELSRLLNSLNTGSYVEPTRLTVGEYLRVWLDDYAKTNVSAKTFERYEEIVRLHLAPALGHHTLEKLHPLHIQELYSRSLESGRRDREGGLSARTVLHHHRVLRQALRHAIRWRLLVANPADAVSPPRPKSKEIHPPSLVQTAKLFECSRGTRQRTPVLLVMTTGMRRGEVLGLRWQDVDLQAGNLMVRQALEETRAGIAFKEPKTAKGRRLIPLPAWAVEHLRRHKAEQAAERLRLGPAYQDNDLVCPTPDGRPWNPSSFSAGFIAFAGRQGLSGVSFQDLRHGHASELLRQGVHPKVVSERLGHSTIAITLDTYSHVIPSLQEEAAEKLGTALQLVLGGHTET